jgi:small-conductance mechanosensitive channel
MANNKPEPLDIDLEEIAEQTGTNLLSAFEVLTTKWALIQIGVVLGCYAVSWGISYFLTPVLENQLRRVESQPQLLRVLVLPLRRLQWILFAIALWGADLVMHQLTRAQNSYYVQVAATLAVAAVVISIASRLIRNRAFAKVFAIGVWSAVALQILGLLDDTTELLDRYALPIGEFRLSPLVVIEGALWFVALLWLATIIGNFFERRIRTNRDLAPALQVLISKFIKFSLLTIAMLAALTSIGLDLTALTVFSGALGIGIGFGLQKVASNLISGIIILMDRSIKPGDVIALGDTFGWINSLKARYVSVVTRDGIEYLIPNEVFVSDRVINWSYSDRKVRVELDFGVGYESDPHQVRELAVGAISEIDRVLDKPPPVCHVTAFGDSSIDFVLRFWIEDPQNGLTNLRGASYLALWDAFAEAGIKIPYPHREVLVRSSGAPEHEPEVFKPSKTRRRGRGKTADSAVEG